MAGLWRAVTLYMIWLLLPSIETIALLISLLIILHLLCEAVYSSLFPAASASDQDFKSPSTPFAPTPGSSAPLSSSFVDRATAAAQRSVWSKMWHFVVDAASSGLASVRLSLRDWTLKNIHGLLSFVVIVGFFLVFSLFAAFFAVRVMGEIQSFLGVTISEPHLAHPTSGPFFPGASGCGPSYLGTTDARCRFPGFATNATAGGDNNQSAADAQNATASRTQGNSWMSAMDAIRLAVRQVLREQYGKDLGVTASDAVSNPAGSPSQASSSAGSAEGSASSTKHSPEAHNATVPDASPAPAASDKGPKLNPKKCPGRKAGVEPTHPLLCLLPITERLLTAAVAGDLATFRALLAQSLVEIHERGPDAIRDGLNIPAGDSVTVASVISSVFPRKTGTSQDDGAIDERFLEPIVKGIRFLITAFIQGFDITFQVRHALFAFSDFL
jgi:hypothetical protein